jgi:hypothetical protein
MTQIFVHQPVVAPLRKFHKRAGLEARVLAPCRIQLEAEAKPRRRNATPRSGLSRE